MTEELHLPAALASRELAVAALVDPNLARARLLCRKYGVQCETAAALDDRIIDAVDGVVIATPNHTHAQLATQALDRGRPVLVEKPLTVTSDEAVALCALARQKHTFISVGFVTRQFPVVPLFKRLLHEGFFGRPQHFHFEYGTRGGWAPVSGYTLSRTQSGGGVLVTNGTHFLDRMLFWFGYPKRFRYRDDSVGGLEANCKIDLEFESGMTGSLFFSKTMALKNRFMMTSDRYTIELPYSEANNLTLKVAGMPGVELSVHGQESSSGADAFRLQLEDFARAVRGEGDVTVSGEAGALSVRLCEELYQRREPLEQPWAWYAESAVAEAR